MTPPTSTGSQTKFKSILPEDIDWQPFSAFPPAVRSCDCRRSFQFGSCYQGEVLLDGTKLMPHKHPEDWDHYGHVGYFLHRSGEKFDGDKVQTYPPGSVIVLPV